MKLIMTKLLYCNSLVPTYCKMSVKMCARCSSGTQTQFTWHSRQDSVCLIVYMYKHDSTALKKKMATYTFKLHVLFLLHFYNSSGTSIFLVITL